MSGIPGAEAIAESYVIGDTSIELIDESIGANLAATAAEFPDADAVVDLARGERLSYAQLQGEVELLARALLAAGVTHGDRVGVLTPNRTESVTLQFAIAQIGAVLVGLNPALKTQELGYILKHAGISLVLSAAARRDNDYAAILSEIAADGWDGRWIFFDTPKWARFRDSAATVTADRLAAASAAVGPDNLFSLQYTSGTTGAPKGAMIRHHSALNNGFVAAARMRLTAADRLCVCVPFFHAFGIIASNICCATRGAAIVISAPTFDVDAVIRAIETERCTVLHGVPTIFTSVLDNPGFAEHDLSTLRTGIMGGAQIPPEVARRVIDDLGMAEITVGFGMSELTSVTSQTDARDPVEMKLTSVGGIHPHLEARIVDSDGRTLPRGEPGELIVRGYTCMTGYWADEARSREAIEPDGWLHTGDLATIDERELLNIVGRLKDMIIRGGENIYPAEIENVLHAMIEIADVQVVGVPDDKYGEAVLAAVRLQVGAELNAESVRSYCRDRLAYFKVPRYVAFVTGYPTTASGKVRKGQLRDELLANPGRWLGGHAAALENA
jgi:fatty-acyl-CoA synthase